ncbi:tyrosine-type recombinase/integrase [Streptomyces anulatus]
MGRNGWCTTHGPTARPRPGSLFKDCGCAKPTRCPHPYSIRFRDALGKRREESGYATQDDAIERLTQLYAEKKTNAPTVAAARRELGQLTVELREAVASPAAENDGLLHRLARAVNVNNVVAQDVYRVREQIHSNTLGMERRRVKRLFANLSPEEDVGMYGFRHYFASNALGKGIPITDVAEWMGHKSIEETCRAYRHLMPGNITKAAKILNTGLWEAA